MSLAVAQRSTLAIIPAAMVSGVFNIAAYYYDDFPVAKRLLSGVADAAMVGAAALGTLSALSLHRSPLGLRRRVLAQIALQSVESIFPITLMNIMLNARIYRVVPLALELVTYPFLNKMI